MLNLTLRQEFCGINMPGTDIALHKDNSQGATDIPTEDFLRITYPTADVIKAVKTVREDRPGGPVVLMGGRGKGKSHLMAVLHHAIVHPEVVGVWLKEWSERLNEPSWISINLAQGFLPISETLSDQEFQTLWGLLFAKHPKGQYYQGIFEATGNPMPAKSLMIKMFKDNPTCLILDEFQTWYESLSSSGDSLMTPERAFNFIQILSEISKNNPDILMLIVSFRDNKSEAFKQIHRQGPTLIDFSGETAKQDRQRLILHRLFENRLNIPSEDIQNLTTAYASERYRLLYSQSGTANPQKISEEVVECWPYSPELLNLLENQILMTTAAQETRDMIRILAMVFKSKGNTTPVITSAHFSVEGDSDGVQSLVDSIATETGNEKLREIAQSNLLEITASGANIPWKSDMVASIWMHSMAPGRLCGVKAPELQLALSYAQKVDDNDFRCQLAALVDHSVNIHSDDHTQVYSFKQTKNRKTEIRVIAQNDNIWSSSANPNSPFTYPGKDIYWMLKSLQHCFTAQTTSSPSDVVVLGPQWNSDPWTEVPEELRPDRWKRLVLIVIPETFKSKEQMNSELAKWLVAFVKDKRNRVRFLLQESDKKNLFQDKDLLFASRCSFLCSGEGLGSDPEYRNLKNDFEKPFVDELKKRFTHFVILHQWNFANQSEIAFEGERLGKQGTEAPGNVEYLIQKDYFDLTDFNQLVIDASRDGCHIKDVLDALQNPSNGPVLPYLGEQKTLEAIQHLAAEGKIAMNHSNSWYIRKPGEEFEDALHRIRAKTATTGSELEKILLSTPDAAGGGNSVPSPTSHPAPNPNPVPGPTQPIPTPPVSPIPTPVPGSAPTPDPQPPLPPLPPPPSPTVKQHHCDPSNASTLIGKFEQWGVAKSCKLKSASLAIEGITVQDLQSMIQRLKSNYKASMDISFDEEEA